MASTQLINNIFLVLNILGGLPHGYISRKLRNPLYRKLFHIITCLIFCYILYGADFLTVAAGNIIVYLTFYIPNPYNLLGLIIPLGSLFNIHFRRLGTINDWKSDISGLVMFTSLRQVMTIFNVYDGRTDTKRENWVKLSLKAPPPFFDFIVYLFSFSALFTGPILPFSSFMEMMNLNSTPEEDKEDLRQALKPYLLSCLFGSFYGICLVYFPTKMIIQDSMYTYPYIIQIIISILYSFFHTSRYIFAWLGGEATLKVQGAHRTKLFDPEYCRSFRPEYYFPKRTLGGLINEWNHSVHFILKEYVHVRVLTLGYGSNIAKFCTFIASAYWHGFYPGYYLYAVFVFGNSILDALRLKWFSPILEKLVGSKITIILDCVFTHCVNYYQGAGWDLLWANLYFEFLKRTKFGPFILEICLIIIGFIYKQLSPRKKTEKKD